jgi:hypothetical protein
MQIRGKGVMSPISSGSWIWSATSCNEDILDLSEQGLLLDQCGQPLGALIDLHVLLLTDDPTPSQGASHKCTDVPNRAKAWKLVHSRESPVHIAVRKSDTIKRSPWVIKMLLSASVTIRKKMDLWSVVKSVITGSMGNV